MKIKLGEKAKEVIKVIAPGLGTALGGPLGGLAGNILADVLLGKDGDKSKLEETILNQTPENILKLRAAEQQWQLSMRQLEIDEEKLHATDRASARDLAKIDMTPHKWLSGLFIGGYFTIIYGIMSGTLEIDVDGKEYMVMLLGVLTAAIPTILQFWFGSSSGSQRKSQLLAESVPAENKEK